MGLDTPLRVKLRVTTKHQRNISRDVGLVLQTLQPVEWLLTVDTLQGRVDVVVSAISASKILREVFLHEAFPILD